LKTIGHILKRYTNFLWAILTPLGIWGVFVIATLDGAAIGLPMDAFVATYVYKNHSLFWLYTLLASAGSAVGSSVLYWIGYAGGEAFLRKRMPEERFLQIQKSFDQHEFWAVMFPAMLPPPTPFKLFVLSAAVFEMNFWHFFIAVFAGRFVRFFILSLLVIFFGPQIIHLLAKHFIWVFAILLIAGAVWLLVVLRRRKRIKAKAVSIQKDSPDGA
jgi:membrane protein YqaA with SNARE-associated domain